MIRVVSILLLVSSAAVVAGERSSPAEVPGVQEVGPGIFRGAQPDLDVISELAAAGVRTILDLRSDSAALRAERAAAESAGMRFVNIPLPRFRRPGDAAIARALRVLTDAAHQPVFVHCKRGADRTGVVVACHRIGREGWSIDAAIAEAKRHGLGWWQINMKRFIRSSCGDALTAAAPDEDDDRAGDVESP